MIRKTKLSKLSELTLVSIHCKRLIVRNFRILYRFLPILSPPFLSINLNDNQKTSMLVSSISTDSNCHQIVWNSCNFATSTPAYLWSHVVLGMHRTHKSCVFVRICSMLVLYSRDKGSNYVEYKLQICWLTFWINFLCCAHS